MNRTGLSLYSVLAAFCVLWFNTTGVMSQTISGEKSQYDDLPNVFIDCFFCPIDYFKKEMAFVNYVRDASQADVFVSLTERRTASDGTEHTFTIIGQNRFAGMSDTLKCFTNNSDAEETIRAEQVRVLKIGLARYALRTSGSKMLSLLSTQPGVLQSVEDPWNHWVFTFSVDGSLNGEEQRTTSNYSGRFSIKRIMEQWKVALEGHISAQENRYLASPGTIISLQRDRGLDSWAVRSIDDHWSVGWAASIGSSTYTNVRISGKLISGIEYNIFPYTVSTRKELRLNYILQGSRIWYNEETVYSKLSEGLLQHSFGLNLSIKQIWGSANSSISLSQYLHDLSKNQIGVNLWLSVRLAEGFSANISANYSQIHDQLSLPKGSVSTEDLLLRRRELETNYNYSTSIGLSYSFGSIYSTIVNPRFGL
ncbi:MAG: hypothetical protein V1799_11740 [bacterium]